MDEQASYWTFQFFAQALCVVGPDLTVAMGYIYITSVVDLSEVAVAGASLQFFVALGFVCGPSLSTLVYTNLVDERHGGALMQDESRKNSDLLFALRASWWFWAALCFAGVFSCLGRFRRIVITLIRFPSALLLTVLFLRKMGKMEEMKPDVKEETSSTGDEKRLRDRIKDSTSGGSNVDQRGKTGH